MTSKNVLLAGIAAGALAIAGQAGAITLGWQNAGATGSGTTTAYPLEASLNFTTGVTGATGAFKTVATIGGPLAVSTTYVLTITYAGATLTSNATSADLSFYGAVLDTSTYSVVPTGATGASTVTYTITTPATFTNNAPLFIDIAPAITVKNAGNVSMTVSLTQAGTPVSPTATAALIAPVEGITLAVAPDTVATYAAATATPAYSQLSTAGGADAVLGAINIAITAGTKGDLAGTTLLIGTALTSATETASVQGDFSVITLTGTGGATFGAASNSVSSAPAFAATAAETISAAVAGPNTTPINPSAYVASANLTLNNTTFAGNTLSVTAKPLQSISRAGYSVIVPWVSSATQSASTGSTTIIRLSLINGAVGGTVYGEVLNNIAGLATNLKSLGTLPSTGDLVIASQDLENAFGNFQRGDIRLTIATPQVAVGSVGTAGGTGPQGIVVKRVIARSSGLTEVLNLSGSGTALDSTTSAVVTNSASY